MSVPGWMPCASAAQLLDRDLELVSRRREELVDLGVGLHAELSLSAPELERQRHEALLRAVMEISLDPPALLVRRGDDARARLLDGVELRPDLGMEAGVHEREARRGGDRLDELRLIAKRRVVDEHGQRLVLVLDPGHRTRRAVLGNCERARRIASTYASRSGSQRPSSSVGILESLCELVPDSVDRRPLEMHDELAHLHAGEARTQEPPEQRERESDEAR